MASAVSQTITQPGQTCSKTTPYPSVYLLTTKTSKCRTTEKSSLSELQHGQTTCGLAVTKEDLPLTSWLSWCSKLTKTPRRDWVCFHLLVLTPWHTSKQEGKQAQACVHSCHDTVTMTQLPRHQQNHSRYIILWQGSNFKMLMVPHT